MLVLLAHLLQVFIMSLREEGYTLFRHWNNTQEQLAEMLTFNVTDFVQCGSHSVVVDGET